jgi:hypothetical protein
MSITLKKKFPLSVAKSAYDLTLARLLLSLSLSLSLSLKDLYVNNPPGVVGYTSEE